MTVCLLVTFVTACGEAPNTAINSVTSSNTVTSSTPAAASTPVLSREPDGTELYALNCMICHKKDGKGGKITIEGKSRNAEDLTSDKIKRLPDEKLIGYVTNGIEDEGMPAFKGKLTPEEIRAVVAHVRTLQMQLE